VEQDQIVIDKSKYNDRFKFLGSILTGPVSRSSYTAKIHRLYRDGRATKIEFKAAISADSKLVIKSQENFAYVSNGQLDWLDILRPIAETFEGFSNDKNQAFNYKTHYLGDTIKDVNLIRAGSTGPVTRWLRTNTFYRKPLVSRKIDCIGDELANTMPQIGKHSVAILPGPYSLIRLVENRYYSNSEDLSGDYIKAIIKSVDSLRKKGYQCILFVEPLVGHDLSNNNYSLPHWFEKSISIPHIPDVKTGMHFPRAEMELVIPWLENSSLDFVGLDLLYSSGFKIKTSKDVLLGVVDGARFGLESIDEIRDSVAHFLESTEFSGNYYIGPNDRLFDIPYEMAIKKIQTLNMKKVF
jgi:methionine synthase II (cobalamin-independent)